jgi:hypothetical protein
MFFECPITKSYRPKLKSTRLGLLSVTGGELTILAIIAQLRRLVPAENFTWDCRQVGHNIFKVTFPDRDEIERLARFGTFHVPNSSIKLNFEQCVSSMEPTSKLPEVWILMSGIPQRRIGDFLAMWSLGTLFGKTLKVDMKYAREKGVLRILVGCLDFRRIPAKERIFIGDGFYDISFEVQVLNNLEMVSASILGEDHSDGDGHGNNGDINSESQKNQDDMDTDTSRNLQDQEGSKNSAANGPDVNRLAREFSSGVKFSPRVKLMMEQSRIELLAFIKSLSSSDTVAEILHKTAAMPVPAVVHAQAGATSSYGDATPAAAISATEDTADPAFSAAATDAMAEISLKAAAMPAPAAVLEQAGAAPAFGDASPAVAVSAAEDTTAPALSAGAGLRSATLSGTPSSASSVVPSGDISVASAQELVPAPCIDGTVNAAAAGALPAIPPNSFRASAEGARKVF